MCTRCELVLIVRQKARSRRSSQVRDGRKTEEQETSGSSETLQFAGRSKAQNSKFCAAKTPGWSASGSAETWHAHSELSFPLTLWQCPCKRRDAIVKNPTSSENLKTYSENSKPPAVFFCIAFGSIYVIIQIHDIKICYICKLCYCMSY